MADRDFGKTDRFEARICPSSYIVLLTTCVLPIAVVTTIMVVQDSNRWLVGIAGGVAIFLIVSLRRYRLNITSGVLSYRNLTVTHSMALDGIDRAMLETVSTGKGSFQRLAIYPKQNSERAAEIGIYFKGKI